jgi:hypothetical protein
MEKIAHRGIMRTEPLRLQSGTMSEETGGQNARVVQDQEVSRSQQVRELTESSVVECSRVAIQMQHPRGDTILQRLLGNQLLGEMKIEF